MLNLFAGRKATAAEAAGGADGEGDTARGTSALGTSHSRARKLPTEAATASEIDAVFDAYDAVRAALPTRVALGVNTRLPAPFVP